MELLQLTIFLEWWNDVKIIKLRKVNMLSFAAANDKKKIHILGMLKLYNDTVERTNIDISFQSTNLTLSRD